jgi:hypothetical protein
MRWQRLTRAPFVTHASISLLLLVAAPSALLAQDNSDLPKNEIIQKSKEAYAALTSYSDEGEVVSTINGLTITTMFTTRLGRPNLYRIEWQQSTSSPVLPPSKPAAVWSSGAGDFLDLGIGRGAEKEVSQEMAMGGATGVSGGSAAHIPGTFFNMMWGGQLTLLLRAERQADEKVGEVDCYVFTKANGGSTNTVWIGKQDFLIRQVRNTASAAVMKEMMDEDTDGPKTEPTETTSIETHTNIVLNRKFSPADFAPSSSGERPLLPNRSGVLTPEN